MGLQRVTRLKLQTRFYNRSCHAFPPPYYKKVYYKKAYKKFAMVPQHSFCFSYNHIVFALGSTVGACCAARYRHGASL